MNKPYKIIMSRGDDIQIDADELQKVLKGIETGRPVIVRRGIFNPSFYVSIVKDKERHQNFLLEIKHDEDDKKRIRGVEPLKDIFKDSPLRLGDGK